MKTSKTLFDFSRYTDAELDQQAQAIVLAMTGNATFPTPDPTLPTVSTAITEYQDALSEAATGDHEAIAIKDQKREALEAILKDLGLYVEKLCKGDVAKILSSGFKASKEGSPIGPLPKPTGFEVMPKGKGEILLKCNAIKGARAYQFEHTLANAIDWIITTETKSKLLLTGLNSGQEYTFRVVPVGSSDIREYSDEVNSFVL
jgi:hypothetical protein